MEEVGKGARLVFRYPASPPPFFLPIPSPENGLNGMSETIGNDIENIILRGNNKSPSTSPTKKSDHNNNTTSSTTSDSIHGSSSDSIDLFFDLKARVFSKLFRPKRPLCGQPLTVNVSGTTFCCRAELFDSQPSTIGEGSNQPLVLFSVVVALAPLTYTRETQPSMQQTSLPGSSNGPNCLPSDDSFSTTQCECIHRNLARLCRVFKREELRCRYVSRQCNMLLQIRKEYEARVSRENSSFASGSDNIVVGPTNTSTAGIDVNPIIGDTSSVPTPLSSKEKHTSQPLPTTSTSANAVQDSSKNSKVGVSDNATSRPEMTRAQRREHDQNLIEVMLAASPPTTATNNPIDDDFVQHGNLARELASVFHLLSSPSASTLSNATSQEGVVYINRHIAIPLDSVDVHFAVASSHISSSNSINYSPKQQHCLQPYHALLFPASSPSEVLESLMDETISGNEMTTSNSISQCLRRILPHIQPNKSIHEIAWEAALALPHVMTAARWLVRTGLCVAALPVLRKNRYVCSGGVVARMATMALPFWQTFGVRSRNCLFFWRESASSSRSRQSGDMVGDARHIQSTRTATAGAPHLFVLVSALTTKVHERSSTERCRNGRSAPPTLGEAIHLLSGYDETISEHSTGLSEHGVYNDCATTEEIIYSMAVWLIANNIIVQVKDSLVTGEVTKNGCSAQAASEVYLRVASHE